MTTMRADCSTIVDILDTFCLYGLASVSMLFCRVAKNQDSLHITSYKGTHILLRSRSSQSFVTKMYIELLEGKIPRVKSVDVVPLERRHLMTIHSWRDSDRCQRII